MSSQIVLDASVAAKWFLTEAGADKATDILEGGASVAAPALIAVEIAAAITRRHRVGELPEAQAELRLAEARDLFGSTAIVLVDDIALLPRASEIAIALKHPLQDCLYIACAEKLGVDLITADPKFLERAAPQFPFVRSL